MTTQALPTPKTIAYAFLIAFAATAVCPTIGWSQSLSSIRQVDFLNFTYAPIIISSHSFLGRGKTTEKMPQSYFYSGFRCARPKPHLKSYLRVTVEG